MQIDYPCFEIIVVDNGSQDDSFPHLEQKYPTVTFIKNRTNRGFAEGNNIGVRHAAKKSIKYFFIVNNDTVVDKDVLRELMAVAQRDKRIAIVGPKVYNYYKKNNIESAGGYFSIWKSKNYQIGFKEEDKGQYDDDQQVNFMSGCAILVKDTVLRKGQLFDAKYFAYFEDTDLCYSVQRKGHQIWYAHKAKLWHKVSQSTGGYKNPISTYLFTLNRIRFISKLSKWRKRIPFMLYFAGYYIPAFTAYTLLRGNIGHFKAFAKAIIGFFIPLFRYRNFEYKQEDCINIGINARYLQRTLTGIERYILEVMKQLGKIDKTNNYTLFYCPHNPLPPQRFGNNQHQYVTKFNTKGRLSRILWEQFYLGKEITAHNIDVFHGTSFVLPFLKSCKYVMTIYDLSYLTHPESFTFINKLYFKFFLHPSIYLADKIIAISQATKQDIMKYFRIPEHKIEVIYGALSPSITRVTDESTLQHIKQKYQLPNKFILFVGLISPRKNLERCIKAFANTHKETGHHFVVVGKKGWLYQSVFDLVDKLHLKDKIIFTDYVPDNELTAFYTLADTFIFPSLYEGFGLPILEAMTCGCPVITSNISSMPEVAGNAALLVNPYSVKEIADAILALHNNKELRTQLITKGHKRTTAFTWEENARKTLAVYESLAR